ncbi:molybdopterin converting factor subunit 1 [Paenibacillus alkalitolerans]|uniref:molybdopterin converting factor subunit 1 n=1 Tax=Paenibacillus alkalitolerans TaxID=2799335 RepID=UPI0018F5791F|nr:molybdopterin converting factor subunit 1 [Paenibacillus alkalitolerans]
MKILLFAGLAEAVGEPSFEADVKLPASVSELKAALVAAFPSTADIVDSCFAAINQSYADDEAIVREGDEVAFIPPVSGG